MATMHGRLDPSVLAARRKFWVQGARLAAHGPSLAFLVKYTAIFAIITTLHRVVPLDLGHVTCSRLGPVDQLTKVDLIVLLLLLLFLSIFFVADLTAGLPPQHIAIDSSELQIYDVSALAVLTLDGLILDIVDGHLLLVHFLAMNDAAVAAPVLVHLETFHASLGQDRLLVPRNDRQLHQTTTFNGFCLRLRHYVVCLFQLQRAQVRHFEVGFLLLDPSIIFVAGVASISAFLARLT
eukprot:CAMPEP_0185588148 /NCGR_PEP_ID=MMETSP0434-20130131/51995_1 /TAXON_ID=626734 ORGANISM="Favella taraikaensis, Strain Fe Narragansett Bay" /NCGR_SAMPLE_ID=MMETSP0434 /ASSEMBLY_ACC=CAM_ASM_000379 /LENGTH=236 /DNA_ID=CAMNT_0028210595 /DNA_START=730 /DNA_END=1441 /DNA_ORIENTATION=-